MIQEKGEVGGCWGERRLGCDDVSDGVAVDVWLYSMIVTS